MVKPFFQNLILFNPNYSSQLFIYTTLRDISKIQIYFKGVQTVYYVALVFA